MSTQVQFHDDDRLQLKGDAGNWRRVGSLRAAGYTEGELEVAADWGAVERHGECHTLRELRALGFTTAPEPDTSATPEQLAAFEAQLRKVDSGFVAIVSTDASRTVGKGVYLTRMAGIPEPRQKPFTFEGTTILEPQPKPAPTLDGRFTEDLGSYAGDVAKRRAAEATPESTFEDEWKNARFAEFASEDADLSRERAARGIAEPRLTVLSTEELNEYAQPDPYAADLKALQARDARALAAKESR